MLLPPRRGELRGRHFAGHARAAARCRGRLPTKEPRPPRQRESAAHPQASRFDPTATWCRPKARLTFSTLMSHADSIKCPECRAEIPLTEVISHQIEEQLAARLAREVAARERQFAEAAAAREEELRREFAETQAGCEAQLLKRAEEKVATELADLGSRLEERDAQIREARERELELRRQKRRLDEERANLESSWQDNSTKSGRRSRS